jgi:hypothetical protein
LKRFSSMYNSKKNVFSQPLAVSVLLDYLIDFFLQIFHGKGFF